MKILSPMQSEKFPRGGIKQMTTEEKAQTLKIQLTIIIKYV